MESWEKFIIHLELTKDIEKTYLKMRKIFKREDWQESDLERPPYYPNDLMKLFGKFSEERDEIFKTLRDYGFKVDNPSLSSFIQNKLRHIDDITPLKKSDGNNK